MGVRWYGKGAYKRGVGTTDSIKATRLYRAHAGDFVFNRIDTQKGAFGVVPPELDGALATNEFPLYIADPKRILACFLLLYFQQESVRREIGLSRAGSEGRARWKESDFEAWRIPLPSLREQRRLIDVLAALDAHIEALEAETAALDAQCTALLTFDAFTGDTLPTWEEIAFDAAIDFREGPGIMAVDFREDGVPLVRLAGFTPGQSLLTNCNYLDPAKVEKKWSHFRLAVGDVLLSTSASLGRVAVVNEEGVGAIPYTGIIRMRPATAGVDPAFIKWILRSAHFAKQVERAGVGITMAHFGPSHLRKMTVLLPPLEEQRRVRETLDAVEAQQHALESNLGRARSFRETFLSCLMSQEIEIPESYDAVLSDVVS